MKDGGGIVEGNDLLNTVNKDVFSEQVCLHAYMCVCVCALT